MNKVRIFYDSQTTKFEIITVFMSSNPSAHRDSGKLPATQVANHGGGTAKDYLMRVYRGTEFIETEL